jgi:hypothetical protein
MLCRIELNIYKGITHPPTPLSLSARAGEPENGLPFSDHSSGHSRRQRVENHMTTGEVYTLNDSKATSPVPDMSSRPSTRSSPRPYSHSRSHRSWERRRDSIPGEDTKEQREVKPRRANESYSTDVGDAPRRRHRRKVKVPRESRLIWNLIESAISLL